MKVKYLIDYTDEFGMLFPAGCVAEHPQSAGSDRIALGVCEEAHPEARARRQPITAPVSLECAPMPKTNIQNQPKHKRK